MSFGLLATGFVAKTVEDLDAEISSAQRASPALGADWETNAESPNGQLNGVISARLAELWELAGLVYRSRDPRNASFAGLDAVAAFTGATRAPAQNGTVTLSVTLNAGVTLAAGSVARVAGQPTNRWVTTASVTNSGGSSTTLTVPATAEIAGPYSANAATITEIAQPVTGWTAVTNLADAVSGTAAEQDPALRARRERELAAGGLSAVDAITAALSRVPGVSVVTVVENPTDVDLRPWGGLPPHAVEAIVQGGTDAAVGLALWKTKSGGIRTWSSSSSPTSVTITDTRGVSRTVLITRPTLVEVYACVQVVYDSGRYPGGGAIEAAVAAVTSGQLAGAPIRRSDLFRAVRAVTGVVDCYEVLLSRAVVTSVSALSRAAFGENLSAQPREVLKLAAGRVAVVRAT